MPRGKPDANSAKAACGYEYNNLVRELNGLDSFSTYFRGGPDGQIQMVYEDHIIEMFRDEAERKLAFLRKIKGIPQKKGIDYAD